MTRVHMKFCARNPKVALITRDQPNLILGKVSVAIQNYDNCKERFKGCLALSLSYFLVDDVSKGLKVKREKIGCQDSRLSPKFT